MDYRPLIAAVATFVCAPTFAVAQIPTLPDYFPDAKKGRLFLTVELAGSGRRDLSNKVEWYRLTASRKLELEIPMMMPMQSSAPTVPVGGFDQKNPPKSPELDAMQKALDACANDRACQQAAMMKIAPQMQANPDAFRLDETRFENWTVDRRVICVKGVATVNDDGDGVDISPPSPAKPYKFVRAGQLVLPEQASGIVDKVCGMELAVDRKAGLASLRLSDLGLPVPVKFTGDAFGVQPTALFVEGAKKLEFLDQKINPTAARWEGRLTLEKIGVASHGSGSTVAPLSGTLTWRFQRD